MRTEALVDLLARSAKPVAVGAAGRQFRMLLLLGAACTAAAAFGLLGVRQDWRDAMQLPMFWAKLAFPLATAAFTAAVLWRLVHPGMRARTLLLATPLPAALVWLAGIRDLVQAPPAARAGLVFGTHWWQCMLAIAVLSIPAFILAWRAATLLAPTRLRLAGAIAGLFAGSTAAAAFSFSCTEMAPAYLGIWYVLGILLPAGMGALVGRPLLRW